MIGEAPELIGRVTGSALLDVVVELAGLVGIERMPLSRVPVREVVDTGGRGAAEHQGLLDESPFVGHDVDAAFATQRPDDAFEQEESVEEDDHVGSLLVQRPARGAEDATRRAEECPGDHGGQRIVVDVGRAQEPPDRDAHEFAQRDAVDDNRFQFRSFDEIQFGPAVIGAVVPARTQWSMVESVGAQRRLDVVGARATRHRWRLVGVGPVADVEAPAACEEPHVRAAASQRLSHDGLVLDMRGPVARCHEENIGTVGVPRDSCPVVPHHQTPRGPLFGSLTRGAKAEFDAFRRERSELLDACPNHQTRPAVGRESKGRPVTIRPTPAQKPSP